MRSRALIGLPRASSSMALMPDPPMSIDERDRGRTGVRGARSCLWLGLGGCSGILGSCDCIVLTGNWEWESVNEPTIRPFGQI